jgi:uroporphyrinogen decarboxylase
MTSRERVRKAYNHEEPDRVPICIGGIAQKFSKSVYFKIKEELKIHDDFTKDQNLDELGNVIYYHPQVLDHFGADFRHINIRRESFKELENEEIEHELGFKLKISPDGERFNIISNPLKNASLEEIQKYPFPDPLKKSRYEGLEEEAKDLYENTGYAIASYKATLLGIFDMACVLRGMDKFLMDLMLDEKAANLLLDKVFAFNFEVYEAMLQHIGDYIEVVEFCDDLGTQKNLILSPDLYRKFLKPRHKAFVAMLKKNVKHAKILIHCCGSIYDIIPDFIDIGIDILNPVQPLAENMDSAILKKEFGKDICFQGGIDLQRAMIGNVKEVENEVKKRIKAFAPGGGYVLSPSNNLSSDVPLENIFKLFECAKAFGEYPINY